jgi:hypothetical protein
MGGSFCCSFVVATQTVAREEQSGMLAEMIRHDPFAKHILHEPVQETGIYSDSGGLQGGLEVHSSSSARIFTVERHHECGRTTHCCAP